MVKIFIMAEGDGSVMQRTGAFGLVCFFIYLAEGMEQNKMKKGLL